MGMKAPTNPAPSHYTRAKPCGVARDPAKSRSLASLRSLRIQLHYQLFLRGDRDARALRALQHPATERLLVDGEPGQWGATRCLIHRRCDGRHLARLHAHANLLARLHGVARNVDVLRVDFDVAVTD